MSTKKVARKVPQLETDEQKRNRETVESIANNLAQLSDAVASLLHGPLKRRALFVLLAHSSGSSQRQVEAVLVALEGLKKDWLQ
jgi:hypothetical protein